MNPRRGEQRGGCGATLSWLSENTVEVLRSATNFLTRSLKDLQNKIDISNEAHELARLITECKGDIRAAKIVLITDGITQKRAADI
ncbi:MAG TPA: hypothetical protein VJ440_09430 [Candidatus Brocadiaceae bacterium]|nr:hypothetical protein [Candidatus Brocadiaceae bacterium]